MTWVLENFFFGSVSLGKGNGSEIKEMRLHQSKKIFYSGRNHQQNARQLTEWENILHMIYPIRG